MKATNTRYAKINKVFKTACQLAKTEPTPRQASKFRRGLGKASRFAKVAVGKSNQEVINREFKDV